MRSRPRRRSAFLPALLASLPLLACKPSASAPPDAPVSPSAPAASPGASTPAAPSPAAAPAVVYGHFRVPSPTGLLAMLRTRPVPEARRQIFEESSFRSLLSLGLGLRSPFEHNLDLERPAGCVVTSFRLHDVPLACAVGYRGGLPQLVNDLGPEGYLSGNDDHAAYNLKGRSIYLTAMGEHVAFAFAPDLVAATRDRIQRDIVDAPIGGEEFVATAFPSVIFTDAEAEITAAIDQVLRAQPSAGGPQADAILEAQRKQWTSWSELERADVWLDATPERLRLGYRGTARPGTATERAYAAAQAVAPGPALMGELPADAIVAMGMRFDVAALANDPMLGAFVSTMGTLEGRDAAIAEQYRRGLALWTEISTGQAAGALLPERGTKGAVVFAYGVRPDVDAVARLREYFEGLQPSGTGQPFFTSTLRRGALRAGKARGDVVTMKPSAEFLATPSGASFAKALGSRVELAYVQRGDVLYMAMAPTKIDRALRRALAAAGGKASLATLEGAKPLLEAHAGDTMVFTADYTAFVRWLDQIDVSGPLPVPATPRIDDVVVGMRPAGERQREVAIDLSVTMLETLFRLAT